MLIFSPRNIALIRARKPDSAASFKSSFERLVGDAVLRVIEEKSGGLDGHPLAAFGVGGEKLSEMQSLDFLVVRREGFPGGTLRERFEFLISSGC